VTVCGGGRHDTSDAFEAISCALYAQGISRCLHSIAGSQNASSTDKKVAYKSARSFYQKWSKQLSNHGIPVTFSPSLTSLQSSIKQELDKVTEQGQTDKNQAGWKMEVMSDAYDAITCAVSASAVSSCLQSAIPPLGVKKCPGLHPYQSPLGGQGEGSVKTGTKVGTK